MLRITEIGHGLKVVEIHYRDGMRCCWENSDGHRWTSEFAYSYSPECSFRSFTYNHTDYEYDEETNRYYYFTESISLRPEMNGALVRRRIGKSAYMEVYGQLLEYLGLNEVEEDEEAETVETTEICPDCQSEVEVKSSTYKTECPVCHRKIMLCNICRSAHTGDCDYNIATDTCRFDSS